MRRALLFLVTTCSFLAVGSSAQAIQSVPNPGFEQNCSSVPCWWQARGSTGPGEFSTLARDTSTVHSGQASLKVTTGPVSGGAGVAGGCFPLDAGSYSSSLWYNVPSSSTASDVDVGLIYYGAGACDGAFIGEVGSPTSVTKDGAWHQFSPSFTAPAGAVSARLVLEVSCSDCSSAFAYFDDVSFGTPTAVALLRLRASRDSRGVLVRWRTGSEVNLLGFAVYRQVHGKRVLVTRSAIPARSSVAGARYHFLDRRGPRGAVVRYWIQEIGRDGSRTWYGPASVSR